MNEIDVHRIAIWIEFSFAGLNLLLLPFITAPYGRHSRPGWGPSISSRWGWVFMELANVALFVPLYFLGTHASGVAPLCLFLLFQLHYFYRTLIYPFRIAAKGRNMALIIVFFGFTFGCLNSYNIARQLSQFGSYPASWLSDERFLLGTAVFLIGMLITRRSDAILRDLRGSDSGTLEYKIPQGGLYRWISCPNYLGEIIQWFGFALATWSLAGLAFAVYTTSNIGPRALQHHRWYKKEFADYPSDRRALLPFLL